MFLEFDFLLNYKSGIIYILPIYILDYLFRKNERLKNNQFRYEWIILSILLLIISEKFGNYSEFIYFQF